MLHQIYIKNFVIIDEMNLSFDSGLNIITGETGAGKSILLGALGLVTGGRADNKMFFDPTKKCVIEVVFNMQEEGVLKWLEENDIEKEEDLILRREISASGRSRSFVNDTPVNLKSMKGLGDKLIDLHQQRDSVLLFQPQIQMELIDVMANNTSLMHKYTNTFVQYQQSKKRLEKLISEDSDSKKEQDYLQFLMSEFEEIDLQVGEQKKLESELNILNHAEEGKKTIGEAIGYFQDEQFGVLSQLKEVERRVHQLADVLPQVKELGKRIESINIETEDIYAELEGLMEQVEYNPERLEQVQDRLNEIYRLQNKHQAKSVEELLEIADQTARKLSQQSQNESEIKELTVNVEKLLVEATISADKLKEKRLAVLPTYMKKVHSMLAELGMEKAVLKPKIIDLPQLSTFGNAQIEWLFSANGGQFGSIKETASGGELSRLVLCMKSLAASSIALPTMIFDEVDTGVSGSVALKMGDILKDLSKDHQVLVITHTPQVASKADRHFFVHKSGDKQLVSSVKVLSQEERIKELATMLSSAPPSQSAVMNAEELLALNDE